MLPLDVSQSAVGIPVKVEGSVRVRTVPGLLGMRVGVVATLHSDRALQWLWLHLFVYLFSLASVELWGEAETTGCWLPRWAHEALRMTQFHEATELKSCDEGLADLIACHEHLSVAWLPLATAN